MNAQIAWKRWYYKWNLAIMSERTALFIAGRREEMYRYRREAALERIIARQQRRIEYLEADLQLAREQVAECEERREFAAKLEFGA